MKSQRLLYLTLLFSLGIHLFLLWGIRLPAHQISKAIPEKERFILSFRLGESSPPLPSSPATPPPSQKPKKKEPEKKKVKKKVSKEKKRPLKPVPKLASQALRPRKPSKPEVHPEPSSEKAETSPPREESKQSLAPSPAESKEILAPTSRNVLSTGGNSPSRALRSEATQSYLALVLSCIEKKRYYPRLARMRGYEGRILLEILIGPKGELLSSRILESSGYRLLDRAALHMVRQAAPFPPPPPQLGPFPLKFRIPIRFLLSG